MTKLDSLRDLLLRAVPALRANPETLSIFVDRGRVAARAGATLSFEYRYTANLVAQDFAGSPDQIIVPVLAWISRHQPDLMAKPGGEPIAFEAELLDADTSDLSLTIELSERVAVETLSDGSRSIVHVDDDADAFDRFVGLCGVNLWQLYLNDQLVLPAAHDVPTPPPDPTPSFSAAPVILGDAIRTAGAVFAFEPGEASDVISATYLVRDGEELRDANLYGQGSGTFPETPGSYWIVSYIADTGIFAQSNIVRVIARSVEAIKPPTFFFDAARVAGTNPPVVQWDDPDDSVLATDTLKLVWVSNGVTATKLIPMDIALRSTHDFIVSEWDDLPAGSWSLTGEYIRTLDDAGNAIPEVRSGAGPALSDTLAAKTLPPATTTWDPASHSTYARFEPDNYQMFYVQTVGARCPASVTNARTDDRFAEITVNEIVRSGVYVGVMPAANTVKANDFNAPAGGVEYLFPDNVLKAGDVITALMTPTKLIVQRNGVQAANLDHSIASYKLYAAGISDTKLTLNTGQQAFSYAPAGETYIRYN